jgi:hypothetical protein
MKKKMKNALQRGCTEMRNFKFMTTKKGKESAKEVENLAEDMLRLITEREPTIHNIVVGVSAVAMLRAYIRKALVWGIAPEAIQDMDSMENLFMGDAWMSVHNDRVEIELVRYLRNELDCLTIL